MTTSPISQALLPVEPLAPSRAATGVPGEFGSMLKAAIDRVETAGSTASQSMEQFISGAEPDLHNVALSAQKAALDFELFLQVRNKVVTAYQEVMRLQL